MFKDQSIDQLVNSGLLREHEVSDQLPTYTYFYRVDESSGQKEVFIVAKTEDDEDHEYEEASFQVLGAMDTNIGFWNEILQAERANDAYGIFGIVTRKGEVVFSNHGEHIVLGHLFDENRYFDFVDKKDTNNTWISLIMNNINMSVEENAFLPSYSELMQTIKFFVQNFLNSSPSERDARTLECDVFVLHNDGTVSRVKQKRTYWEWKKYLEVNAQFIQKYQELKPPFSIV